jgi:hypothetical protein
MCWNADISLNTFLFGCFALIFIYITNTFTKYKSKEFDHPWSYIFVLSFLLIQLMEFFLWKNLKNDSMNRIICWFMVFILSFQPVTLMMMIQNQKVKYLLLTIYLTYLFFNTLYMFIYKPSFVHAHVGHNGHLDWEWVNVRNNTDLFNHFIYACICIPIFFYLNNFILTLFILSSLFVTMFFFYKDNTFGTMWCWVANIFLLYFVINILMVQPFMEYNGLC